MPRFRGQGRIRQNPFEEPPACLTCSRPCRLSWQLRSDQFRIRRLSLSIQARRGIARSRGDAGSPASYFQPKATSRSGVASSVASEAKFTESTALGRESRPDWPACSPTRRILNRRSSIVWLLSTATRFLERRIRRIERWRDICVERLEDRLPQSRSGRANDKDRSELAANEGVRTVRLLRAWRLRISCHLVPWPRHAFCDHHHNRSPRIG
jgi:hypothetical protein